MGRSLLHVQEVTKSVLAVVSVKALAYDVDKVPVLEDRATAASARRVGPDERAHSGACAAAYARCRP